MSGLYAKGRLWEMCQLRVSEPHFALDCVGTATGACGLCACMPGSHLLQSPEAILSVAFQTFLIFCSLKS